MFVGFGHLGQTFGPLKSTQKTAQKTYLGRLHILHSYSFRPSSKKLGNQGLS